MTTWKVKKAKVKLMKSVRKMTERTSDHWTPPPLMKIASVSHRPHPFVLFTMMGTVKKRKHRITDIRIRTSFKTI